MCEAVRRFVMEAFVQKRLREQRRHIPPVERQSEAARYYDCATERDAGGPSLQMVRHNAMKCWEGYERVPGTTAGADGSCRKKGSGGGKKTRKKKDKAAKKDGDASSSSSSSSDDEGGNKKKKKKKKKKEEEGGTGGGSS